MSLFRKFRITVLLYVLLLVAAGTWLTALRTTDWNEPLWITVYPIDGDGRPATRAYMGEIDERTYASVADFMSEEAAYFGVELDRPVLVRVGPVLDEHPPAPPEGGNVLSIMLWSLRLRAWATFSVDDDGPPPDVKMFVIYHDPKTSPRLRHSLGLQKGLIGVVNAFATRRMTGSNAFVVAHELMHTLGATDRYDPGTGLPVFPSGFADPSQNPRFPQEFAEIMGGRIPLSPTRAEIPASLARVVVGPETAREIRWIE